jgi:hypothetical protein
MKAVFLSILALALVPRCWAREAASAAGTPAAGPLIVVEFSNPGLTPSHWVLSLRPDGSGHFRSETGAAPGAARSGEMQIPDVSRDILLTPKFTQSVFQTAERHNWFNEKCESHMKVAFQGYKTLSYSGPQGKGSCTFNYSRDKDLQSLGDSFIAVSQTILEGVRLEMLLQHDPLGLDKEIESLSAAAKDGRARQICVIRGILQRLAQDNSVMEMVRKRAQLLLDHAETT